VYWLTYRKFPPSAATNPVIRASKPMPSGQLSVITSVLNGFLGFISSEKDLQLRQPKNAYCSCSWIVSSAFCTSWAAPLVCALNEVQAIFPSLMMKDWRIVIPITGIIGT